MLRKDILKDDSDGISRGKASEAVQVYLGNWIQNECERVWRAIITRDITNMTVEQAAAAFYEVHESAKYIDKLQRKLLSDETNGREASRKYGQPESQGKP